MENYKPILVPPPKGHKYRAPNKREGLKWWRPDVESFEGVMDKIKELGRDTFIVGISGGKDSICLADRLDKRGEVHGVLHLKTNIGVAQTLDFIRDTCKSRGWTLYIREPTPHAFVYAALCLETGFPGPALHSMVMKVLKYRTMQKFVTEPSFKGKNPIIITGVRRGESVRRMGNYMQPINKDAALWFGLPLFYESDEQVYRYFVETGLSKSPVADILGFSGECYCGAFANQDELEKIRFVDPKLADYIAWIGEGIKKFGTERAKKYSVWGRQGMSIDEAQEVLTKFFGEEELETLVTAEALTCGSECGPSTMKGTGFL